MAGAKLINSLVRGMTILELVSDSSEAVTLTLIAEHLGVKLPTAHNLVKTLLAKGFLAKAPGKRYRLGPGLLRLTNSEASRGWLDRACEELKSLAQDLPAAVLTLAENKGRDICVTLRMVPDMPGVVQRPENRRFGLYGQITGLVTQAFANDTDRLMLQEEHSFYEEGAHLWGDINAFNAFLEQVRKDGFGVTPFEEPGFLRAAAPVFGAEGNSRATLGLSLIMANVGDQKKAAKKAILELRTAAERLSTDRSES